MTARTMEILDVRETTLLKIGLVQLLIFALLIFALVNRQPNLSLLLLVLLVFIHGARLWSKRSPDRLTVRSSLDRTRVFPGEKVLLTLRAENHKPLPVWLHPILPIPEELADTNYEAISLQDQSLLWYQSAQFATTLAPQQRGIYQIGPPRLIVGDLLGLYPREKQEEQDRLELIVYPRLRPVRPFAHIKRDLFGSPGGKSPVQDPVYLLGTRDYQAGRPSRYIHWVASARLNRLQERDFEPSRQARVLFLLDASSFAIAKAVKLFEKSIEVLASLAIQCDRQGFGLGLATDGRLTGNRSPIVPVGRSGRQATLILETLAAVSLVNHTGECCLTETLKRIEGIDSGLSCVLFTLSRSAAAMGAASMLRQKNLALTTVYCLEENTVSHQGNYPKTLPLADLLPQEETKA